MDTPAYPRGQLRVSDADRDRAVAELSEHFQAGRLTQDEFEDRTGQALQARTGKELATLFTDLPRPPAPAGFQGREPAPTLTASGRAAIARIAVAVCAIVVVSSIVTGFSGAGSGHRHPLLALAPIVIVLVVVRSLFLRHRAWDHRSWDHRSGDHRHGDHRPR